MTGSYCIFSVTGRDEDFLYYSHTSRPLRSLMFGRDFVGKLPQLMKNEELCIECGLGLSIAGGVALDSGDCVEWHCSIAEANRMLSKLKEMLGRAWVDGSNYSEAKRNPGGTTYFWSRTSAFSAIACLIVNMPMHRLSAYSFRSWTCASFTSPLTSMITRYSLMSGLSPRSN